MTAHAAATQDDSVALLQRWVRDRDSLREPFGRVWRRLDGHDEAALRAWAAATLRLAAVNAGPACLLAFWAALLQGGLPSVERLNAMSASGQAAADICRHAGARAALACLEALPVAARMAGSAESLAGWWRGLRLLAGAAPAQVRDVAERAPLFLAQGDGAAFADFVAAGLKATAAQPGRRAAFFRLEDELARALLARAAGGEGFAELQRMLSGYATALWDGAPPLRAAPLSGGGNDRRASIVAGVVLLPPMFAGVPAAATHALYRAAAAHCCAHCEFGAGGMELGQLKPLQLAMIGLIEDARVEALAIRRLPGLRRLWASFHVAAPDGLRSATGLMARLGCALLDPAYADSDGFVEKGRALFAAERLEDATLSRRIGGLLANDLGQMRVQFNARTYVVEPAYRDDNMHLWALPEQPDDAMAVSVEAARGAGTGDGGVPGGMEGEPAGRARDGGRDTLGALLARYPEWDAAAGVERADWTSLRDVQPRLGDPARLAAAMAAHASLYARIARLVASAAGGRRIRLKRQPDGEELDLDAAIDATIARRAGDSGPPRIYRSTRPGVRDIATMVILDTSLSTATLVAEGQSVLDAQRLAVAALAVPLQARGDAFALRAFASNGRDDVRVTRLKDFAEPFGPAALARLAGLHAGLSTRLGTALRHAAAEFAAVRATRKLLLVLTDGEPSDIDVTDPHELVVDARRAVLGLRAAGVDVFGIVLDPGGAGSGAMIFDRPNLLTLRGFDDLPARLASIYFRLAQR